MFARTCARIVVLCFSSVRNEKASYKAKEMHASSNATVHVTMTTIVCLVWSDVFRSENIYRQNLPIRMRNILRATSGRASAALKACHFGRYKAHVIGEFVPGVFVHFGQNLVEKLL